MAVSLLYAPITLEHDTGAHPENAGRLRSVIALLEAHGLWEALPRPGFAPVDRAFLERVHDPRYVALVQEICAAGHGFLTADTPVSARSFDAASAAAGAAVHAVELVLDGEAEQAFCLMRPPGHHACHAAGMGFCLFNSMALAAHRALDRGLERVLIVDFDVHHGNGTQELFYDEQRVLYISAHQHPAYPGTGLLHEMGIGAGRGFTLNVPLPAGVGDAGYQRVFEEAVVPAARRFRPELILASAGYDAHWTNGRYLSSIRMGVTVGGFAMMTAALLSLARELCDGRLALVLEGGYDPEALAWSVLASLRVLRGEEWEDPIGAAPDALPEPEIGALLATVRTMHGLA